MSTTTVLSPIGLTFRTTAIGSRAITDLAGIRIAVLDNTKPNAVEIMEHMARLLVRDHGAATYHVFRKLSAAQGASEQQFAEIAAGYDLAITGSGDCGGCTSWSALDAVELEHRGVPTVLLVTDPFAPLARTLVREGGIAELRFAQVAHPIGGRPTEGMAAVAEGTIQSVIEQLKLDIAAA